MPRNDLTCNHKLTPLFPTYKHKKRHVSLMNRVLKKILKQ